MNRGYIFALIYKKRYGKLIHLMQTQSYLWSKDDIEFILDNCDSHYSIIYYMKYHMIHHKINYKIKLLCYKTYDMIKHVYHALNTRICDDILSRNSAHNKINTLKFVIHNRKYFQFKILNRPTFMYCGDITITKYIFSENTHNLYHNSSIYDHQHNICNTNNMQYENYDPEYFKYMLSDEVLLRNPKINPKFIKGCRNINAININHIIYVAYLLKNKFTNTISFNYFAKKSKLIGIYLACAIDNLEYVRDNYRNIQQFISYDKIVHCSLKNLRTLEFVTSSNVVHYFGRQNMATTLRHNVCWSYDINNVDALKLLLDRFGTELYALSGSSIFFRLINDAIHDEKLDILKYLTSDEFYNKTIFRYDPQYTFDVYDYETAKYILSPKMKQKLKVKPDDVIDILECIIVTTYRDYGKKNIINSFNIVNYITSDEIIDRFNLHDYINNDRIRHTIEKSKTIMKNLIYIYK